MSRRILFTVGCTVRKCCIRAATVMRQLKNGLDASRPGQRMANRAMATLPARNERRYGRRGMYLCTSTMMRKFAHPETRSDCRLGWANCYYRDRRREVAMPYAWRLSKSSNLSISDVRRMNSRLMRRTTTRIRDSSDLGTGIYPYGAKQCQRTNIIKPPNFMKTQPSPIAPQPKVMAAESMTRDLNTQRKHTSTPRAPIKARPMPTSAPGGAYRKQLQRAANL